jgi:hypothetical protein
MSARHEELATWLRAQIEVDRAAAREAMNADDVMEENDPGVWRYVETPGGDRKVVNWLGDSISGHYDLASSPWWTGPHIALHDPATTLLDVDATLLIVGRCEDALADDDVMASALALFMLWCLAARYASRPGFREEWRV